MLRHFTPRRLLALLLILLLAAVVVGQHFRLFERAWFAVREWQHEEHWRGRSVWLPDYRVAVEAQPIAGLEDDVSALTYDPQRRSLFTVTNQPAQIIELSLEGRMLRKIVLRGFGDTEAIEYIAPGRYVLSDERRQRLFEVRLDDATRELDANQAQQLSLGIGEMGNKGFEGLAYDPVGMRLFVAQERDPVRILEVRGFPQPPVDQPFSVHVLGDPERDSRLFVRDLSSLQYDAGSGHLLALSDESRLLLELDVDGKPISSLSLLRDRQGLQRSVPQAEGVAMDGKGTLYLVSEPNLFYVFRKSAGLAGQ
ncbi:SdiA-regulated domain-containing protein [Pseudomonas knackmussii]|uniref:SdiA-regulated domain-containing protein n=1 Tax=Pseudomonas knackmussii TaxID=65741 RepID=UPI0013622694|nr:SdiA-regulated domain-containing protein [Pseudomonas knackmussii]